MNRRDSDYCPACDRPWDECNCPRLERLNGGVVPAAPEPPAVLDDVPLRHYIPDPRD